MTRTTRTLIIGTTITLISGWVLHASTGLTDIALSSFKNWLTPTPSVIATSSGGELRVVFPKDSNISGFHVTPTATGQNLNLFK